MVDDAGVSDTELVPPDQFGAEVASADLGDIAGPVAEAGVDEVGDADIHRALDLALAVAAAGARTRPPIASPPELKPYLRFQRVPVAALGAIRQAVESDQAFRHRVARIAREEIVGAVGMLWLNRPEGWRQLLIEQPRTAEVNGPAVKADRRRREAAEHVAVKAAAELAVLRSTVESERARRSALEHSVHERDEQIKRLRKQLAEVEAAGAVTRERLAQSARQLADHRVASTAAAQLVAEVERARDDALAGRAALEADSPGARDDPTNFLSSDESTRQRAAHDHEARLRARKAIYAAADEMRHIVEGLERSAALLVDADETGRIVPATATPPPTKPAGRRGGSREQRQPLAIPGGLHGDSVAAATHLLRQPGVLVIIDGYNVAMLGWPELTLEQQRSALLQLLDDLVRRLGTRIIVVFDGSVVGAVTGPRRLVRVVFSDHGVTADDEIRRLVSLQPARQSLVVVTNDRAIVNDIRQQGANPVSSDVLLRILRR